MRRAVAVFVLCAGLSAFGPSAEACGDKFLVIGRGVRRIPRAAHPASVLLYMKPGSRLPVAARDLRLEPSLKQAGHVVDVVEDSAGLQQALATGRYDLLVADLPDARAIRTGRSRPLVVPVAYRASAAELAEGRGEFGRVVKAPDKGTAFLKVIDEAAKDALRAR